MRARKPVVVTYKREPLVVVKVIKRYNQCGRIKSLKLFLKDGRIMEHT